MIVTARERLPVSSARSLPCVLVIFSSPLNTAYNGLARVSVKQLSLSGLVVRDCLDLLVDTGRPSPLWWNYSQQEVLGYTIKLLKYENRREPGIKPGVTQQVVTLHGPCIQVPDLTSLSDSLGV